MGEYFLYANLDRREFFSIAALGGSTKRSGIGGGITARALGLLLLAPSGKTAVPDVGRWVGDRVIVIGDHAPAGSAPMEVPDTHTPYSHILATFRDLRSTIAVMVFQHDGPEDLMSRAAHDDTMFILLSELAILHSVKGLAGAIEAAFGPSWKKLYGKKRAERPHCPVTQPP